jgi:poly(hydroxyalkanoate) depolymerase family esterase
MIDFSLSLFVSTQLVRKSIFSRGSCLALTVMLAAAVGACKMTPATEANTRQNSGNAGLQSSPAPSADQASLDQTISTARSSPLLPGAGFPLGFCAFFPSLPGCPGTDTPRLLPGESEVSNFGSNPGNLKMFKYIPKNLASSRPLVVALHGCTQSATTYDDETGWTQLADKLRFALVLPQQDQRGMNNPLKCFRWFDSNHNQRGKGEALSIKQMIDTMTADTGLNVDRKRVYVTGLSAGGAMTAVMMATYPETFAGGAPVAGIPYGCAKTSADATSKCGVSLGGVPGVPASTPVEQLSPAEWGNRVRNASAGASFPRVSIWQGTSDHVVNPQAQTEMIEQWTNVLGVATTPQVDNQFKTTRHQVFQDSSGKPVVEAFTVKDMDHGTPIDPGSGADQCGTSVHDQYIIPAGICSSFYIAKFWGL